MKKNVELILHEVSKETRKFLQNNKKLKNDDIKKMLIPEILMILLMIEWALE